MKIIKMKQINVFLFTLTIIMILLSFILVIFISENILINKIIENSEEELKTSVFNHLDQFFQIPKLILESQENYVKLSEFSGENPQDPSSYFASIIDTLPSYIYSYSYGNEQGDYFGARRIQGGMTQFYKSTHLTGGHSYYYNLTPDYSIESFYQDFGPFDPRTREWYIKALVDDQIVFSNIYEHFVMKDMTLSLAKTIEKDQETLGVLGIHLTLSHISNYLKELAIYKDADLYIINNSSKKVVGSTAFDNNYIELNDDIRAIHIEDLKDSFLYKAYHEAYDSQSLIDEHGNRVRISSNRYLTNDLDWQLITALPEKEFKTLLDRIIRSFLIVSIIITAISLFVWLVITKKMLKPIELLIESTQKFSQGSKSFNTQNSRIEEINRLSRAFKMMAETISKNISEIEESNVSLSEAKLEADQANRYKSDFIAQMSHEIRTPMNGIIGLTDLMMTTNLDEDQKDMLSIVKSSSLQLLEIINNILDISKIESGRLDISSQCINLMEILNEKNKMFSSMAKQKGIGFEMKLTHNIPEYILSDGFKLNQILNNIIGNAIKFTDDGYVSLRVSSRWIKDLDYEIEFLVEDTGPGIAPAELTHIFQPFVQLSPSRTAKTRGTGLGLAIVKRLVDILGGEINVTSQVGQGSIFSIVFQFKASKDLSHELINPPSSSASTHMAKNILLVEDDEISVHLISRIADKYQWTLYVAKNGQEAMDLFINNTIDIILSDVHMQPMDGLTLSKKIRAMKDPSKSRVTIIGISASAMKEDIKKALDSGMDEYLSKPVDINKLISMINNI